MVFYLNPRSLGFGSVEGADDVGLGGYYSVVKLSSAIDDGKFTTTVRGVFLAPSISPFPTIKTTNVTGKEGSKFQLNDLDGVQTFGTQKTQDEQREAADKKAIREHYEHQSTKDAGVGRGREALERKGLL